MLRNNLLLLLFTASLVPAQKFQLVETTIADVHAAYKTGKLNARQLTQMYLDRIAAFDKAGPKINCVITVNSKALAEADALDSAYRSSGPVGPLHGILVVLKDQMDVAGLPTTLGALVMKDNIPVRDSFVVEKLKAAGAIILAKVTLGEMGGGDTYGSLFGETHNPYDLDRTVGGSSGGTGAAVTSNFATIGIGQEGFASIRRPSTWNSIVGMRPTPGLVSRGGVWAGWPSKVGSLGPMTRTVTDLAKLLDVMVGYDPDDPMTAMGYGKAPTNSYTESLKRNGLMGARIGILRQDMGQFTEPEAEDYNAIGTLFDRAVADMKKQGAEVVENITIPRLNELLATRGRGASAGGDPAEYYFSRNPGSPFQNMKDVRAHPDYAKLRRRADGGREAPKPGAMTEAEARDELMIAVMKVMADNKLDAIVHKSVEHTATLIKDGINPPYLNHKGAPHLNTFLIYAASIAVPAGFTPQGLPAGITFFGRPYSEPKLIQFAYAYEQATHHRVPPKTVPALPVKQSSR